MQHSSSSLVCIPEMRDPMTWVATFLRNPSPLRNTCSFKTLCYNHSVYLESAQSCPYVTLSSDEKEAAKEVNNQDDDDEDDVGVITTLDVEHKIPVLLKNIQSAFFRELCKLHLVDLPSITRLDGKTMQRCVSLCIHQLRVARLPDLQVIGNGFLDYCPNLAEAAFQELPQLTSIGDYVLRTTGIVKFELSDAPKLRSIGTFFLSKCVRLTYVSLSNLPSLCFVGDYWMAGSRSVKEVRVRNLLNLVDHEVERESLLPAAVDFVAGSGSVRKIPTTLNAAGFAKPRFGLSFRHHLPKLVECKDVEVFPPSLRPMKNRADDNEIKEIKEAKKWRLFRVSPSQ